MPAVSRWLAGWLVEWRGSVLYVEDDLLVATRLPGWCTYYVLATMPSTTCVSASIQGIDPPRSHTAQRRYARSSSMALTTACAPRPPRIVAIAIALAAARLGGEASCLAAACMRARGLVLSRRRHHAHSMRSVASVPCRKSRGDDPGRSSGVICACRLPALRATEAGPLLKTRRRRGSTCPRGVTSGAISQPASTFRFL